MNPRTIEEWTALGEKCPGNSPVACAVFKVLAPVEGHCKSRRPIYARNTIRPSMPSVDEVWDLSVRIALAVKESLE